MYFHSFSFSLSVLLCVRLYVGMYGLREEDMFIILALMFQDLRSGIPRSSRGKLRTKTFGRFEREISAFLRSDAVVRIRIRTLRLGRHKRLQKPVQYV
jgi:hypothetical protein